MRDNVLILPRTGRPGSKCALTDVQSGILDAHSLQLSTETKPLFHHDYLNREVRRGRSQKKIQLFYYREYLVQTNLESINFPSISGNLQPQTMRTEA